MALHDVEDMRNSNEEGTHGAPLWLMSILVSHVLCVIVRRNPLDVRVGSRQKFCSEAIYIVLQTSVRLF